MTIGYATGTDDFNAVRFNNDVGGTYELPPGRYRVALLRSFEDYETGTRMVGILLDEADIETATKVGTTGYAPPGTVYRPTTVYFSGRQFEED